MITLPNMNIELEERDFSDSMSWYEVTEMLNQMPTSRRLPTRDEFSVIHKMYGVLKIDEFSKYNYWCTENDFQTPLQFNMRTGVFDPEKQDEYYCWENTDRQPVRFINSME